MFRIFRKFFVFAGDQKNKWKKGIIFAVLHSLCEAFQMLAIAVVLKAMVENTMDTGTVWLTLGIMVFSVSGTIVTRHISHKSEITGSYAMCEEKRIGIGDRMKYMPMGYFNSHSLGNITAAATTTMEEIEKIAPPAMVRTIHGLIRTFIMVVGLTIFDWRMGLISFAGVLLFLAVNALLQRKSHLLSPMRQSAQAKLVEAVLEYIQGMSVVKTFHLDKAANKNIDTAIREVEKRNFRMEIGFIPYVALQQLVLRLTSVTMVLASVTFYLNGTMELFMCLLMIVCGFFVYTELEAAGLMSSFIRLIDASIDRVEEIHQTPVMDINGHVQQPQSLDIAFRNVSFSYENRKIIDNVSFTIPQGTTTAIVGPSGGGKTTLCNLMARFWDVDEGAVTLGGKDVREYKLDSLLENISMVFQHVYLFNDTILNNIRFGKPNADMEEVVAAAKKACCHEFITALSDGYDTVIGEGGATLSGGEKQRISIARAMLKDAPIVILDEATANVDPENESKLQEAVAQLTKNKTVVMIAHRLKTVRHADQILVVDSGKIVQRGTHNDLIRQRGIYSDFIGVRRKAIGWKLKAQKV
ncbi:ABC transporter ATP-binding protein [Ruminiclostridium cellobioparum]|uniref:ABC transporter, ATP-binding protein n=1 Tax=Ruminiclostridium cellobioparum subsp. termitidis CT1112 TaxID=1195236 RepID=S0FF67_RUMCE|nr:ABC transporter ATP-binding protein [Ruminiclostridium cellobioparum]EMS69345.1 ABC transporter, ATP-binding protein [Ruminiclostridium cellobioparum subsp. termitidis CT1112]